MVTATVLRLWDQVLLMLQFKVESSCVRDTWVERIAHDCAQWKSPQYCPLRSCLVSRQHTGSLQGYPEDQECEPGAAVPSPLLGCEGFLSEIAGLGVGYRGMVMTALISVPFKEALTTVHF